jgi:hypothetical protein
MSTSQNIVSKSKNINSQLKECVKCLATKNLNEFPKGRRSCKICCNLHCKLYKQNHKIEISEYNKNYKLENKETIKQYNHEYNIDNRKTIQTRHTAYLKNKRKTDPKYKMSCILRNRIKAFLFGENRKKTRLLLGCDYDQIKHWLQYQFYDEMTFENHGTYWHIDHVIPCSLFDINDEKDQLICFNWSNLQPMKSKENLSKKNKVCELEIIEHEYKVLDYIKDENININKYIFTQYNKEKYYSN